MSVAENRDLELSGPIEGPCKPEDFVRTNYLEGGEVAREPENFVIDRFLKIAVHLLDLIDVYREAGEMRLYSEGEKVLFVRQLYKLSILMKSFPAVVFRDTSEVVDLDDLYSYESDDVFETHLVETMRNQIEMMGRTDFPELLVGAFHDLFSDVGDKVDAGYRRSLSVLGLDFGDATHISKTGDLVNFQGSSAGTELSEGMFRGYRQDGEIYRPIYLENDGFVDVRRDVFWERIFAEFFEEDLEGLPASDLKDLVSSTLELAKGAHEAKSFKRGNNEEENFRLHLEAMLKDVRIILVKLAARLHNLKTLSAHNEEKAKRIALDSLRVSADLADVLKVDAIRDGIVWGALPILRPELCKAFEEERDCKMEEYLGRYFDDSDSIGANYVKQRVTVRELICSRCAEIEEIVAVNFVPKQLGRYFVDAGRSFADDVSLEDLGVPNDLDAMFEIELIAEPGVDRSGLMDIAGTLLKEFCGFAGGTGKVVCPSASSLAVWEGVRVEVYGSEVAPKLEFRVSLPVLDLRRKSGYLAASDLGIGAFDQELYLQPKEEYGIVDGPASLPGLYDGNIALPVRQRRGIEALVSGQAMIDLGVDNIFDAYAVEFASSKVKVFTLNAGKTDEYTFSAGATALDLAREIHSELLIGYQYLERQNAKGQWEQMPENYILEEGGRYRVASCLGKESADGVVTLRPRDLWRSRHAVTRSTIRSYLKNPVHHYPCEGVDKRVIGRLGAEDLEYFADMFGLGGDFERVCTRSTGLEGDDLYKDMGLGLVNPILCAAKYFDSIVSNPAVEEVTWKLDVSFPQDEIPSFFKDFRDLPGLRLAFENVTVDNICDDRAFLSFHVEGASDVDTYKFLHHIFMLSQKYPSIGVSHNIRDIDKRGIALGAVGEGVVR